MYSKLVVPDATCVSRLSHILCLISLKIMHDTDQVHSIGM